VQIDGVEFSFDNHVFFEVCHFGAHTDNITGVVFHFLLYVLRNDILRAIGSRCWNKHKHFTVFRVRQNVIVRRGLQEFSNILRISRSQTKHGFFRDSLDSKINSVVKLFSNPRISNFWFQTVEVTVKTLVKFKGFNFFLINANLKVLSFTLSNSLLEKYLNYNWNA